MMGFGGTINQAEFNDVMETLIIVCVFALIILLVIPAWTRRL